MHLPWHSRRRWSDQSIEHRSHYLSKKDTIIYFNNQFPHFFTATLMPFRFLINFLQLSVTRLKESTVCIHNHAAQFNLEISVLQLLIFFPLLIFSFRKEQPSYSWQGRLMTVIAVNRWWLLFAFAVCEIFYCNFFIKNKTNKSWVCE